MTPIERAAQAVREADGAYEIARVEGEPAAWMTEGGVVSDDHFRDIARAVLLAIREPSDEMCNAAYSVEIDFASSSGSRGRTDGLYVWQAMIDAALEEG